MRFSKSGAAVVLACYCGLAAAQMGNGAKSTQEPGTSVAVSPATAEDQLLSALQHEFTGVAEAMPADKYNFAPMSSAMAGSKFDGVRTFAGEITHVISANYYFFGAVSGTKPDVNMDAVAHLTNKDEILKALAASFAFAHQAIRTITPQNAFQPIEGADGMHTRATVASFAVAHGFDHYGQMVEYLRMNGILPPGSK